MAILSPEPSVQLEKISAKIPTETLSKIKDYIAFANLGSIDAFLNQASKFVFAKDAAFKTHIKSAKNSTKK